MLVMDQLVQAFCEAFEDANSRSDVAAIGGLYAETFLFAGPHGAQAVKKEDFLKVIPRMKAHFASLGLSGTHLASVEASNLDPRYALAKVRWTMTLDRRTSVPRNFDVFATYLLMRGDEGQLSIVLQLDHQDLAAVIDAERKAET
jgi:ketosteroid isomerase-like protein